MTQKMRANKTNRGSKSRKGKSRNPPSTPQVSPVGSVSRETTNDFFEVDTFKGTGVFGVMQVGNIYWPLMDMGKKFIVEDTLDFELSKEDSKELLKLFKLGEKEDVGLMINHLLFLKCLNKLWEEVQKDKELMKRKVYLCPIYMDSFGENLHFCVDVLKPLRWYHKFLIKRKTTSFIKGENL